MDELVKAGLVLIEFSGAFFLPRIVKQDKNINAIIFKRYFP
jgi:hypothetical protein